MSNKNKQKPQFKPSTLTTVISGVESTVPANFHLEIDADDSSNTESTISNPLVEDTSQAQVSPSSSANLRYAYKVVVTRNNLDVFQLTVTEHLNDGWELSGGVSCTMYSDSYSASTIWSQALYKNLSK